MEHVVAAFDALLALGIRDRTTFAGILRQTLDVRPEILSTWTVWEPNALDGRDAVFRHAPGHDATGRFIACWHRAAGEARLEPVTGYEEPGGGGLVLDPETSWAQLPYRAHRLSAWRPVGLDHEPGRADSRAGTLCGRGRNRLSGAAAGGAGV